MSDSYIMPWDVAAGLPWPVAVLVVALILGLVAAFVVMPVAMLVLGEPADARAWLAEQRRALARARLDDRRRLPALLRAVVFAIDSVNRIVGQVTAWVGLMMVLIQFSVVIMRYVFSVGSIQLQETIWYSHGILFMVAAGYTLLYDGHVRVDIFYREASPRKKAMVDLFGVVAFLLPMILFAWSLAWPYVANSWRIKEESIEASGLAFIYLFKTVILIFLVLLFIQAIALALRSVLALMGAAGERSPGERPAGA